MYNTVNTDNMANREYKNKDITVREEIHEELWGLKTIERRTMSDVIKYLLDQNKRLIAMNKGPD